MILNVLSGKGGTGKTTVATNLAWVLSQMGYRVQLLDADVEEPNDHIFFEVDFHEESSVDILLPVVDENTCDRCGECSRVCQFGAIVTFPKTVMVFESLCHGCGTCVIACSKKAISERPKSIGKIMYGTTREGISLGMGLLNIGEPSGVRIIRELKKNARSGFDITIIDSPPGTSCPVVESLRGSDFALLVTESTPFGLHDLKIAERIVSEMGIRFGVVVNRYDPDFEDLENFLRSSDIRILMRIPFRKDIARLYSEGKLFTQYLKDWQIEFEKVFGKIEVMMK